MKMQCEFLEVDNDAEEGKDLKGRMAAEKGSVPKDQEVRSLLPTDEIGLAARDCMKMQDKFFEVDNAEEGGGLKGRMEADKDSVPKDQEARSLLSTDEVDLAAKDSHLEYDSKWTSSIEGVTETASASKRGPGDCYTAATSQENCKDKKGKEGFKYRVDSSYNKTWTGWETDKGEGASIRHRTAASFSTSAEWDFQTGSFVPGPQLVGKSRTDYLWENACTPSPWYWAQAGKQNLARAGRRIATSSQNNDYAAAMALSVRQMGALLPPPNRKQPPRQPSTTFPSTTAAGRRRTMSEIDMQMLEMRKVIGELQQRSARDEVCGELDGIAPEAESGEGYKSAVRTAAAVVQEGEENDKRAYGGRSSVWNEVVPRVLSRDAFRFAHPPAQSFLHGQPYHFFTLADARF
jgi:hypothetical protein